MVQELALAAVSSADQNACDDLVVLVVRYAAVGITPPPPIALYQLINGCCCRHLVSVDNLRAGASIATDGRSHAAASRDRVRIWEERGKVD